MAKEKKTKPEEEMQEACKETVAEETTAEPAEEKIQELEDKYLRLAAEYKNYQNRTQREKEALYTSAVGDAVKELLPVLDSIQFAAESAKTAT
ncbi:MAG: nucleotide exchange factor GrpE, partial [Clostridia bacterium]|nr:nucleotide exchange factor GrpE [Clostridia bacterium]